jgi:hypothetical protein
LESFSALKDLSFAPPVDEFDLLTHESGPFTKAARAGGQEVTIEVRIFHSDMFVTARRVQHDLALEEIVSRDVFFYNGHAGPYYGFYLDEADLATVYYREFAQAPFSDRQQLVIAQGCQTYSQYSDMLYAHRDKGEDNLDVITSVNYAYARGTVDLLRNLVHLDDEGNHQPVDFDRIISELNGERVNRSREVFYGVTGITEEPQLHPYGNPAVLGQSCTVPSDCGDSYGHVCVIPRPEASRSCGLVSLSSEACPEGAVFRYLLSGDVIQGGACVVVGEAGDPPLRTLRSDVQLPIPDEEPKGVSDTIVIDDNFIVATVMVEVHITHSFSGDLVLRLAHNGGDPVELLSREGGATDDIRRSFTLTDFNGHDAAGSWTLTAVDASRRDEGTMDWWQLSILPKQ